MLSNTKKIFNKSLKEAVQTVYNPQYNIEYIVYPPFSNGSDLLINLWELLNIKPPKIDETIPKPLTSELYDYFWILLTLHSDLIILSHDPTINLHIPLRKP